MWRELAGRTQPVTTGQRGCEQKKSQQECRIKQLRRWFLSQKCQPRATSVGEEEGAALHSHSDSSITNTDQGLTRTCPEAKL